MLPAADGDSQNVLPVPTESRSATPTEARAAPAAQLNFPTTPTIITQYQEDQERKKPSLWSLPQ
jgi:hypothetical protein